MKFKMGDFSKEISSKFPSIKVKAILNIVYTANIINRHHIEYFKPYDISPQQYNILRILRGAKQPLNVQAIKDKMLDRAPNITRLMDKLTQKKLIQRFPAKNDRRVVNISITKEGLLLLDKIPTDINTVFFENISDNEAETLSDLLDKLR